MKVTEIQDLPLWGRLAVKRVPASFSMELTARCNNNCSHCYINVAANDEKAQQAELSAEDILRIGSEAAKLGALWCLLSGGEPLLRHDFTDIYLGLKRLGLLVSLFTNACLVTETHVGLFKKYPPRDIEVSVYGASKDTYEKVTRRPGSWEKFNQGLDLLQAAGIPIRLKVMALRSNAAEFEEMGRFCRSHTKDFYRFDPLLHLRYDGNPTRNSEIVAERLSSTEVIALEKADPKRMETLERGCREGPLVRSVLDSAVTNHLFQCGAGKSSFVVGYDGTFRLCGSLCQPGTTYDLRSGTLREAWEEWVPSVRESRSDSTTFLEKCARCPIINLCLWCPAHAALETGELDGWVEYFCEVAHARAAALQIEGYRSA